MNIITKWDPIKELDEFQSRLSDLFSRRAESGESNNSNLTHPDWAPMVDIAEDDREYVIEAELPRVDKDKVKVKVADGMLSISGEREFKREQEEKSKRYHRIERSYGRFVRTFRLPEDVDSDKVKAEFKDGLLSVHLPKSEAHRPKEIDIRIS